MKKCSLPFRHLTVVFLIGCSYITHAQIWNAIGSPGFSAGAACNTSIAVNSGGSPYVAFTDSANGNKATVMMYDGSNWVTVGAAGFSAGATMFTAIAVDGSGTPYVSYQDAADSNKATVMKYDGSSWVAVGGQGFTPGAAYSLSMTLDGSGTPYVVFGDGTDSNKATVMKYDGGTWVTIGSPGFSDGGIGGGIVYTPTGIVINSTGTPYVIFMDLNGRVMKYDGTAWVGVGYGFSAYHTTDFSLAIGKNDTPYFAYTGHVFGVRKFDGSNWTQVGSESPGITEAVTLTTDKNGIPLVLVNGQTVAKCVDDTTWQGLGHEYFPASKIPYNSSIVTDGNSIPYVVYSDASHGYKITVEKLDTTTDRVVHVSSQQDAVLSVYPNPTTGSITLVLLSTRDKPAHITITNMLGEKVKELNTTTNKETQINLDAPAGVYFINAITAEGTMSRKVVLE